MGVQVMSIAGSAIFANQTPLPPFAVGDLVTLRSTGDLCSVSTLCENGSIQVRQLHGHHKGAILTVGPDSLARLPDPLPDSFELPPVVYAFKGSAGYYGAWHCIRGWDRQHASIETVHADALCIGCGRLILDHPAIDRSAFRVRVRP
jgi:hypothetical protein